MRTRERQRTQRTHPSTAIKACQQLRTTIFSHIPICIYVYMLLFLYVWHFKLTTHNAQRPRPKSQLRVQTDGSETNQTANRVELKLLDLLLWVRWPSAINVISFDSIKVRPHLAKH